MPNTPQTAPGARQHKGPASTAALTWRMTAWVAAVFSVLVGVMMLLGKLQTGSHVLLESPQLKQRKEALRLSPAEEQKKQSIRDLDLQLRQKQFRHLAQVR